MEHLVYWIWLSLRCGAGSELGSYLLKHFSSPKEIFEADESALRAVDGIDDDIAAALLDRDLSLPRRILEYCERVNVGIMTCESAVYPGKTAQHSCEAACALLQRTGAGYRRQRDDRLCGNPKMQ